MPWSTTGVNLKGPQGETGNQGPSAAPGPKFIGTTTLATTVTSGTWTAIPLNTEVVDTHNCHSTSSATSRFVVPAGWDGLYRVSGASATDGTGGSVKASAAGKNGVPYTPSQANYQVLSGISMPLISTLVSVVAGDYIELLTYQNSGANRSVTAGLTTFTVEYVA